jgi:hypothetical protein
VLLSVALLLVAWGAFLWVDAGTRHSEMAPSSSALHARAPSFDGPNRLPAQLVWVAAAGVGVVGVLPRKPSGTD